MGLTTGVIELKLSGVWTAITADVRDESTAPKCSRGMKGGDEEDRTATPSSLNWRLNNSSSNSGGVRGWYSFGNASVRSGFQKNIPVRWKLNGQVVFYGYLESADPAPGRYAKRDVACVALGYMNQLARCPMTGVPTLLNTTADAVLTAIVAAVPVAPIGTAFDVGSDLIPVALDAVTPDSKGLDEAAKVNQSERGWLYDAFDGTLTFKKRSSRYNGVPVFTLDGSNILSMPAPNAMHINRVRGNAAPRTVSTSNVTLFTNPGLITINPAVTEVVQAPFTDPNNRYQPVGGTSIQTPTFTANSRPDGLGANVTANVTLAKQDGGSSTQLSLSVSGTAAAYILPGKLAVSGIAIYTQQPVQIDEKDQTSIDTYGLNEITINTPYLNDPDTVRRVAHSILATRKNPIPTNLSPTFVCSTSTLLTAALAYDIGTCITVDEDITGTANYFINGIEMELRRGGNLYVTWHLWRADTHSYFTLGSVGTSVLGGTDVLAA